MPSGSRFLFTAAAFVVVVAGMRAASDILVPFLLAVFISIICSPLLFWLKKKGVRNGLAVCSTLIILLIFGMILVMFLGTSVHRFTNDLPFYQMRLTEQSAGIIAWVEGLGLDISAEAYENIVNPGRVLGIAANTLKGMSGMLTNVFMILLTVLFILFEASTLPRKIAAAMTGPEEDSLSQLSGFMGGLNRYLAIKTLFSLLTGVAVGAWLAILGVDYPILWGLLAFFLNYVPSIGSIIAAVPACLLALVQLGVGPALLAVLGYLVVNFTFGNLLEPRFMGRRLGLSTLVVWLSLVFWGWVLGPLGMLLSVPLTMIVKIILESKEDTRGIAILLGSGHAAPVLKPDADL